MNYSTKFTEEDKVTKLLEKYANMVRRICFLYLQNQSDGEDVFQEVFFKLITCEKEFESEEYKKAWICRVTINYCKDLCKSFYRTRICSIDDVELPFEDKIETDVLEAVLSLPPKLKDVVYLSYYQNYTAPEISQILNQSESTVYSHLHRAKRLLRKKLGGYKDEQLF
jgi:RNA polymerase sigma factor (sigma-70 family)